MEDSFKLKGLRERLAQELLQKGIKSATVLDAIRKIPRHVFVESAFAERSYEDTALPIAENQTISQPFTVAVQTELLVAQPGDKILEIGTGSGYQCAILCELGCKVFSIERNPILAEKAKYLLTQLGYQPKLKCGDGSIGWSTYQPYDGIIVTAAAPSVPDALLKQLAIRGRLVIPVGDRSLQQMYRIIRIAEQDFEYQTFEYFKFVPLLGDQGWREF